MRVYIIPAQELPYAGVTEGNLADLQYLVGGLIQPFTPPEMRKRGITLLCSEDGLLTQMPVNINMFPFFFVGTLVAVGVAGDEFVSLTPDQEEYVKKWLEELP